MTTKDYLLSYQKVSTHGGKPQLRVVLQTAEYGPMESRWLAAIDDESLNQELLNSLADEVIDAYEAQLAGRPKVFTGWATSRG